MEGSQRVRVRIQMVSKSYLTTSRKRPSVAYRILQRFLKTLDRSLEAILRRPESKSQRRTDWPVVELDFMRRPDGQSTTEEQ